MNDRVNTLLKILNEIYPEKISFITENDPWRFLVTVMLSASTTDKQAIKVAAELFKRFPEPSDFADAEIHEIETIIKPAGLYRTKAPRIKEVSSYIARNGLPHTEEELMNLPGIGEKTAACYLEHVLSLPAVIADTHFVRVAYRLGFTDTENRLKAAAEIRERFPKELWSRMSMVLNLHGRTVCKARPVCSECALKDLCPSSVCGNAVP